MARAREPLLRVVHSARLHRVDEVTAVLVAGAIAQAQEDGDVEAAYEVPRLERLLPTLEEVFREIDEDESGVISRDELTKGLNEKPQIRQEI
jgi:hypothetical protein